MKFFPFAILLFLCMASSCGKGKTPSNNVMPSNLVINAVPATDSSGNVAFKATATNAVTYDFDYGNGIKETVATGIVTHKYLVSGTYGVSVTAKSATGQTISGFTQVTVALPLKLVWSDEFNTPGAPDPAKWGYDLGAGGWGNAELQDYTNRLDNAVISDGTLKIIAKAERYNSSAYTSARLLTKDKFSVKYGTIEARIKVPPGVGTWPAFWMLGSNISTVSWPACGEIDIMEHVGKDLNTIFATLHFPGNSGGNGVGNRVKIPTATTDFHTYKVEWSANKIHFFVDGNSFHTFINSSNLPFNQTFFIILNIAMGGNFGGPIESGFNSATMEVDYVRVYQ